MAKKHKRYGELTPWPLRWFALIGYLEYSIRGISLIPTIWDTSFGRFLRTCPLPLKMLSKGEITSIPGSWCEEAEQAINLFMIVYVIESIICVYPGWISMHKVSMGHMYEHHFPGAVMGAAIWWNLKKTVENNPEELPDFWQICQWPFAVGLISGLCEAFFVYRSFSKEPDTIGKRLTQRILGIVLVGAMVVAIHFAFWEYFGWTCRVRLADHHIGECIIVPVCLYLALVLHPSYVKGHMRRAYSLLKKEAQ